jgi:uncharacterized protein (PEP-CTERM system associated)
MSKLRLLGARLAIAAACTLAACTLPIGTAWAQQPTPEAIDRGVVGGVTPQPTDLPLRAAEIIPRRTASLDFGVAMEALFSDNFALGEEGREASGRSLELSPYLEGFLRTAKSQGVMSLRLRGLWYDTQGMSDTNLSPEVKATGDFSIRDDSLRLAGSTHVFRTAPSPFAATPIDPAGRAAETDLYREYTISPYSLGRLGRAEYELRYRASSVDTGGITPGSVSQQVAGGLASSRDGAGSLGWSANADVENIDFDDDTDLRRTYTEALAYYRALSTLRVGAGIHHAHVDVLRNADGDDSGFGPTAFVSWRPTSRTAMTAKWSNTYYGNETTLSFTHRRARWLLGVAYIRTLQAGSEASLLYLDPNRIFQLSDSSANEGALLVQSLAERRVSSGAGRDLAFGQTRSRLVFSENLVASLAVNGARNSLVLSVFQNDQQPIQSELSTPGEFDLLQRGITLDADHRLTQSSSLFLSTQYLRSESDQTGQDARLASFALGWRMRVTRQAAFTVTARTSRQTSEGAVPSNEYRENAAYVTVDYRF